MATRCCRTATESGAKWHKPCTEVSKAVYNRLQTCWGRGPTQQPHAGGEDPCWGRGHAGGEDPCWGRGPVYNRLQSCMLWLEWQPDAAGQPPRVVQNLRSHVKSQKPQEEEEEEEEEGEEEEEEEEQERIERSGPTDRALTERVCKHRHYTIFAGPRTQARRGAGRATGGELQRRTAHTHGAENRTTRRAAQSSP
ncbi:unnamed protein product [Prorocentrum cordatum]|uniref:Uncharacterized protein n=1 Tax=Prorocentrum cordatum TaxID=2364126 RepID=A0ABN9Q951_9DINO|nr:unnamed protein product [Polarella glacialis]